MESMPKKPPRILLVDDNPIAIEHYTDLLKGIDAEMHTADNGFDGLARAASSHYDLIVTDVSMPDMTGIEMCQELQKKSITKDIPIVMVSGFDSDEDIEAGFEAGATAYLSRNDINELLEKTVVEILWKYTNIRQKRILVVEDSKSIAKFVSLGLMKNAFQVMVAENGNAAIRILKLTKPDLILSDMKMPELDGVALCRWVKSVPELSDIPFIAMSAGEEPSTVQRIIQYGAAAYVLKPFSITQLILLIDRLLSDHFRIILKERERLDAERKALVNSISGLITALEARDPYTKGHSESVSKLAVQLLATSGVSKTDLEIVAIGGKLHDIGKIGIRDSVLLKPGRLTSEEFEHIKEHPTIGRTIIETIPSLEEIVPIVYSHHERWDGKGYPQGLKGTDIPLWARALSVADTFDALTSDRPYRAGMPLDKAVSIITDEREKQLCPESVDRLLDLVEKDELNTPATANDE